MRIKTLTKQDEEMTEWDNFIYEKIHPFTAHPFAQDAWSSSEIGHPGDKLRQKEKRKEEREMIFWKGRGKSCLSASGEWEGLSLQDSDSCHLIPECRVRWTSTSQQLSLCPSTVTGHQRCNPAFNIQRNWISLERSLTLHHDLSRLRLLTTIYGQPLPAVPFPHPS